MNTWVKKNLPDQSDVHVDTPLTNMSLGFMQADTNFVAGRVFQGLPVSKQTDKFYTFDRSYWFRDEMAIRADGAESAGAGFAVGTDTYDCDVYSLHKDLGNQLLGNADAGLSLDQAASNFLTLQKMIRQEVQFATDFFVTGKWGTSKVLTTKWSDKSSDIIYDIELAKKTILQNTGQMPNVLTFGYETWEQVKQHPDIIARLDRGQTNGLAQVTRQAVAALFELDEVLVMSAIKNSADEGAAASYAFIGGKHALLTYRPPSPGILTPAAAYTFTWTGMPMSNAMGTRVKRWWSDDRSAYRYEIDAAFDCKIVSTALGYFWNGAVA